MKPCPVYLEALKDGSGFIVYADIPGAAVVKKDASMPMPGRVLLGVVRQTTITFNGRVWLVMEPTS